MITLKSAKGYYWKALNLYQLQVWQESLNSIKKCLDIQSNYPSAHYIASECLQQLGKYEYAVE